MKVIIKTIPATIIVALSPKRRRKDYAKVKMVQKDFVVNYIDTRNEWASEEPFSMIYR